MMHISLLQIFGILLSVFTHTAECAPSERKPRQSPFGGGMGASPFHSGHGGTMHGPMGGMGNMGPSMGGPTMGGQSHGSSSSMFRTSVGLGCVRHHIVCPKWCLSVDSNGCKSCPCGPGGMNAASGGPSGSPMGGPMSGGSPMGGAFPFGGGMQKGGGGTSTGGIGNGGTVTGSSGGSYNGGGSVSKTATQTYVTTKPVKECAATLLCSSTCKQHVLGSTSSSGCRSCSCPSSHHVSTTTVNYIVQTVQPAKKECSVTSYCMRSCDGGYVMSNTDGNGCPECSCLKVDKPYVPPIEIAVEPPPDRYQYPIQIAVEPPQYTEHVQTLSLTCAAHSCNSGCTVGYKCGRDGCPSCECIHPAVVGLSTVNQIYIEKPVRCRNNLACPSSCSLGYKCGVDGCPTCECLVATTTSFVQTRPQYTAQTCTHTLTCAATCTNGYELFTDGTSSCSKCACKQQAVYAPKPSYAVQRPGPQYQIVQCPSTDSCSAECPYGYEVIRTEGRCPKCQCKQGPLYYVMKPSKSCDNCDKSYYGDVSTHITNGGGVSYVTGTSGTIAGGGNGGYVISSGRGENSGYVVSSGGGGNSGYVISGGGGGNSGYVVSSGSGVGGASVGYRSNTAGIDFYGSSECAPLPPDCQPSCIKYDTPHCRKCVCETSYVRYSHG